MTNKLKTIKIIKIIHKQFQDIYNVYEIRRNNTILGAIGKEKELNQWTFNPASTSITLDSLELKTICKLMKKLNNP